MDHQTIMNEAAWHEADEALARAIRDMPVLDRELERLGDNRAKQASNLVFQWVRQAARMRHVRLLGNKGELVKFDPVYHADFDEVGFDLWEEVKLVKPPIVRGEGEHHIVLLQGEVESPKAKVEDVAPDIAAQVEAVMNSTSTMARRP